MDSVRCMSMLALVSADTHMAPYPFNQASSPVGAALECCVLGCAALFLRWCCGDILILRSLAMPHNRACASLKQSKEQR